MTNCKHNWEERNRLYANIEPVARNFKLLKNTGKFIWLMSNEDPIILHHTANFIRMSFAKRNSSDSPDTEPAN
jgi:hypothetical protein